MTAIKPAVPDFTPAQLRTIKNTVAKDTAATEFDLFMAACRSYGLDPFRRQISCIVYNKKNQEKRKMVIIIERDGRRVIAARCGDYRPAAEKAAYEYDPESVTALNPKGIVSATVTLFKQDRAGVWHPVIGEAYWDEFAPIQEAWGYDQAANKRKPTGAMELRDTWQKMPRLMVAKCAEGQALRAGWPEQFGGAYFEEEMQRTSDDHTASESIEDFEQSERAARIGGPGVLMVFDDTAVLTKVQFGDVHDRVAEYIRENTPADVHRFRVRNEAPLRDFWAHDAAAALNLKKLFEDKERAFEQEAVA